MKPTLTTSQRLTAAAVEGAYWLTALLLRLVESTLLLTAFTADTPAAYGAAAVGAVGYSLLLAPVRLGRQLWYTRVVRQPEQTPPIRTLWAGYRYWRGAVGWRWSRWWRLTVLLLVASSPTAMLWGYGDRLTRLGEPALSLLWLLLGSLALLGGLAWWCARRCRYSLVPLLLARGCSAPLAMQLSIRLTRGRTGVWVDFWVRQAGWVGLCLLVPPAALWVLPRVRLAYTWLLTGWIPQEQRWGTCILPTVSL